MTERDALLAAIRATPDDDTPRLVFADWLDEHEPDAKPRGKKARAAAPSSWAALIRAECEFARLQDDGSAAAAVFDYFHGQDPQTFDDVRWERALPEMSRRVELFLRLPALRRASAKARHAGRPKVAGGWWTDETHRGFPHGLRAMDSAKFYAGLPALLAHFPPAKIDLVNPIVEPAGWIAAGFARWCRDLRVDTRVDGHADLIAAMSRAPDTAGVRALYLGVGHEAGELRALAAVAESPQWSGLRELTLDLTRSFNFETRFAEAAEELLRAPHLRGLRRMRMFGNGFLSGVVAALDGLTELRALTLNNCGLSDGDAVRLAEMPSLANLRLLHLHGNAIGGRGASALLASPHLANLAALHLEGNPVRGLDRAALASAPVGGLRALNLQSARLTVADLAAAAGGPRASELMYFAACYNRLPETAVARLVKAFGSHAPAVLYLMDNNISTAGAQALANWPAAERIDMLHLSGNDLPTPGAKAIAACPHLAGLKHLCAGTTPAGRTALKKRFGARASV